MDRTGLNWTGAADPVLSSFSRQLAGLCRIAARVLGVAAVVSLLAAMAGCAVNEKKEVSLYRKVLDGQQPIQVSYRPSEPLTLSDALLLANANNEQLAISGEDYVQALIDKDRAASNFFPTITLLPSYSRADTSSDAGNGRITTVTGTVSGTPESGIGFSNSASGNKAWDTPANLNVNLFRGFRDVANIRRTESEINRLRANLLDLQMTVLIDVARTYYQVLASEASVRVLEISSQTQEERVQEMRTRNVVGAAQALDVAQIEAQAAATRASLVAARNDVHNARLMLAFLVAAPVTDAPLVDKLDIPPAISPPEVFTALAQADRQDLKAAQAGIESARQGVQVAFGQYYPSVSLNINYYLSRMTAPTDSEWNGLLAISVPIFTGGRIHADYRTALSQLRQAKEQESLTRRQIDQEVLTAYQTLTSSTRRLEELRVETAAAQTALDVAEGRYRAGLGTYLERLIAQDQQLQAQLDYTNEAFSRKILYLNLLRATGELSRPTDPVVLTVPPVLTTAGPSSTSLATQPAPPLTAPSTQHVGEAAPGAPSATQPAGAPPRAIPDVPGINPTTAPAAPGAPPPNPPTAPTTLPTTAPLSAP